MRYSIEEIFEIYPKINEYSEELMQTQSEVLPFLSKDMKDVLKNSEEHLKMCMRKIEDLQQLRRQVINTLDKVSEYDKAYETIIKLTANIDVRREVLEIDSKFFEKIECLNNNICKQIDILKTELKDIDNNLSQLNKLKKDILKAIQIKEARDKKNIYFCVIFLLSVVQIIFNFREYGIFVKIIDSILFIALLTFLIITIFMVYRSKRSTKLWQLFVVILHFITILLVMIWLNCFKISSNDRVSLAILLISLIAIEYQVVDNFMVTRLFSSEFIIRLIILCAVWGSIIGFFFSLITKDYTLLKIGIMCYFTIVFLIIINSIFFRKEPLFNEKFRSTQLYKLLLIIIYGSSIFLFPYYVKWWGLQGSDYQSFINIYSYVIGGLLTLGGVSWTIRQSEKQKNQDMVFANRPLFYSKILNKKSLLKISAMEILFVSDDVNNTEVVVLGVIENSDNSNIIIDKLIVNSLEFKPINNVIIAKSKVYKILLNINENITDADVKFYVKDVLNNEYVYNLKIIKVSKNSKKYFNILQIKEC